MNVASLLLKAENFSRGVINIRILENGENKWAINSKSSISCLTTKCMTW